ncbi:uncharacterized protein JCM15063_000145 [Sporobolomyces koalae]|uniref:uncharacterized protein n=1 Tax=Sporobolomyces koalae TaxID=500713 RepID=UPI003181C392
MSVTVELETPSTSDVTRQASALPNSPFVSFFATNLSTAADTTLETLSKLSRKLYDHRVGRQVDQELTQLQGELRAESRPRTRALKADYMARMVWNDEHGQDDTQCEPSEREGDEWDERSGKFEHPTIVSDPEAQATMSATVDRTAEDAIEQGMIEARARIQKAVETTQQMELEIWLSQTLLDGYQVSAGDEAGAARFIEAQLEDELASAGLEP